MKHRQLMLAIMGVVGLASTLIFAIICCVLLYFQKSDLESLMIWQSRELTQTLESAQPAGPALFGPTITAEHHPFALFYDAAGATVRSEGAQFAPEESALNYLSGRFYEEDGRLFYVERLSGGERLFYGVSLWPLYGEVIRRMVGVVVAGVIGIAVVLALIYALLIRYSLTPLARFFERYHEHAVRGITKQESMNGAGVVGEEGVHPRILTRLNRVLGLSNLLIKKSILFESFTQKAAMETEKEVIYQHLYRTIRAFFPIENLTILELNHSANRLEAVFQHPDAVCSPKGDMIEPAACAAFRYSGDVVQDCDAAVCARLDKTGCGETICVPMFAQGAVVGVCRIDLRLEALEENPFKRSSRSEYLDNIRIFLAPFIKYTGVAIGNINITNIYKNQAITDALTGLYNRRYLVEAFVNNLEVAKRRESPVGCFILDVDNFKRFNDEFGHKVGDLVLKKVAKTLQTCIRSGDIAGRFGGEEFLVILPDTPDSEVFAVAERVRTSIAAIDYDEVGLKSIPKITVSIGIAAFPVHGYSHYHITHAADQALYRAKNEGKNRSVIHHDPKESGGN